MSEESSAAIIRHMRDALAAAPRVRQGFSVAIRRDDGSEFLCTSARGITSPIWPLAQRSYAVAHKRELIAHGFKARVVRVTFTDPRWEPSRG